MASNTKPSYYAGIDIGTTSVKAVAFDANGNMLAKAFVHNSTIHPQPGYSEQDPLNIASNTFQALDHLLNEMGYDPDFISLSAAMHGLIAFDDNAIPLTPCFTWADIRANDEASHLQEHQPFLYEQTGVPLHPMSPLCKLLWLQEHQPILFKKAYCFAGIKEFIIYQLTGKWMTDTSMASATGLFNIHNLQWDERILKLANISIEQLPPVQPANSYFSAKNERYASIPFILGGSDGAMAAYASYPEPVATVSIGTSAAVRIITESPHLDPEGKLFCYHIIDQLYVNGGASNNGAIALQWWKENILNHSSDYEILLKEASHIAPGSDGVFFLPYLSGERAPVWNAHAKAAFIGLQIHHQQAVLTRAVAEGVLLNLTQILNRIDIFKYCNTLQVAGGFAASEFWLQLLADITNRIVVVVNHPEASAWGAVKMGLNTLSIPLPPTSVTEKKYYPNLALFNLYHQLAIQQQKFYRLLNHLPVY